jgi:hypothetical protein
MISVAASANMREGNISPCGLSKVKVIAFGGDKA